MELDARLAEAHSLLGTVKMDYEWDFAGAEREIRRAMEIDPKDGGPHEACARLLRDLGKHDEELREMKLARDLDPLNLRLRANVGNSLYFARKYAEAEQELKKELEFEPDNCIVYIDLQKLYAAMGRYEEAPEYGSPKYSQCAFGPMFTPVWARPRKREKYSEAGNTSVRPEDLFPGLTWRRPTAGWAKRTKPFPCWKRLMKKEMRE